MSSDFSGCSTVINLFPKLWLLLRLTRSVSTNKSFLTIVFKILDGFSPSKLKRGGKKAGRSGKKKGRIIDSNARETQKAAGEERKIKMAKEKAKQDEEMKLLQEREDEQWRLLEEAQEKQK